MNVRTIDEIFSGSCFPGCDLEDALARGHFTRQMVQAAIDKRYGRGRYTLAELAQIERDKIRALDI